MKTNPLRIVALTIVASILLVPAVQSGTVFADEPGNIRPEFKMLELPLSDKLADWGVNEVGLVAFLHFSAGEEVVNGFRVFDTKGTGFDRNRGIATFTLEGVISEDRPLLYEAVDKVYYLTTRANHDFKEFDVDVVFTRGSQPYRIFAYENCIIKAYNITTLTDREEGYNLKTDFAYVDRFDFECRGAQLFNPTYDEMLQSQKEELTAAALAKMKIKNQ